MANKIFLSLIFLINIILITSCNTKEEISEKQPLNILWLVAEDLSPYIPAFGDSTIKTPVLSKLAQEGVCYDNFYTPHPVCAPARAALITGMYANHIAASHMRTGPWYSNNPSDEAFKNHNERLSNGVSAYEAIPQEGVKMFTEYLRKEGYYCSNNAKEDYQFAKSPMAWDESGKEAHWRKRNKNQPFFSVFNFEVTHESRIWSKAEDSLWIRADLEVPVPPYLPDTEVGLNDVRRMYSNIAEMDSQVGKIIEQLEEDGLLNNTIIFWYSDHGGPLPRQKRLLYDSGLKVPMIIRFPYMENAGTRDERMISFIDLAPTILSIAGIQPPGYMDGKAFLGEFKREEEPQYIFAAADRFDEKTDRIRAVRDNRYKYMKNYMPEKPMYLEINYRNQMPIMQELLRLRDEGKLSPEQALWFRMTKPDEELYDTWKDPHELKNLADNPDYQEKLIELRTQLENWTKETADTGLKDELELYKSLWPDGKQPVTENPEFSMLNGKVEIICETQGASIGYQYEDQENSWNIYSEPIEIPEGKSIRAIAHRIGYKRSAIVNYNNE